MKPMFRAIQQKQMDAVFDTWRDAALPRRPPSGWIKAIRESLGMPAAYLARRLKVVPSSVLRMESSETDNTISLATLHRAAEALGCELHYCLVPRQSIEHTLHRRAEAIARIKSNTVNHTMTLENQAISEEAKERQVQELTDSLLRGARRELWK